MALTSQNSTGIKTFRATAVAIAAHVRVTVDSAGLIAAAGANDSIGVTLTPIVASGTGSVKLWSAPGTFMVKALTAFAAAAVLYPAAGGTVDDAAAGALLGLIALDAATAAGDIVEAAFYR